MAKKPAAPMPDQNVNQVAITNASDAMVDTSSNSTVVSAFLDYFLPYDEQRVTQEVEFFLRTSAESMLEAGKRLLMLKENEPHGKFSSILEKIGLPPRTAQRMMQASLKYLSDPKLASNAPALAHLGKAKLFQLMDLDDETLIELSEGGTIAGLKLSDIQRMTTRQLQEKISALQGELEEKTALTAAKDGRIADLGKQVDQLKAKKSKITPETADEAGQALRSESASYAFEIESMIRGNIRKAFDALQDHGNVNEIDHRTFMRSTISALGDCLADVSAEFDLDDGDGVDKKPFIAWANGAPANADTQ